MWNLLRLHMTKKAGSRTVSNNGSGSLEHHFRSSNLVQVHSSKVLLVQVRFGFTDLKFNCRYSFRPEKKALLMITTALIVRVPAPAASGYGKIYSYFFRGSGSVWIHLSTILRVQVWFRFTEVKFCWFRFGSGSTKWNGLFGFTVWVQVQLDTLKKRRLHIAVLTTRNETLRKWKPWKAAKTSFQTRFSNLPFSRFWNLKGVKRRAKATSQAKQKPL